MRGVYAGIDRVRHTALPYTLAHARRALGVPTLYVLSLPSVRCHGRLRGAQRRRSSPPRAVEWLAAVGPSQELVQSL